MWCKLVFVLIVSSIPVFASTTDRMVIRDNISPAQREELAQRLRLITGWTSLEFNEDGALRTGSHLTGGSQSARDLMNKAFSGSRTILFEDASGRKDVVFCRVILAKPETDSSDKGEVHLVQIDFSDFQQVTGDKQARAAFNVGWAVLHEIDHVVSDSSDPQQDSAAGDCEDHINKMRRELGLPVRSSYFFSYLPIKNDSNLVSKFVRLGFDEESGPASKRRRYWLIWDAAIVGGLG
ncbi:MAG TPA: hypothetical protein VFY61_20385 [Pyrinomonadaceae bacterium]|nr:hypothetical protein [Pyrinomonadaceae bacterium]